MATRALVYDSELIDALVGELGRATDFKIAVALVTQSGLPLLIQKMSDCLRRGGQGDVLIGFDLPSHPDAVAVLLELRQQFAKQLRVKRFKSPSNRWFHPKLYIFTPRRGRPCAVVGSSNMTFGGLKNNYEASLWSDEHTAVAPLAEYLAELHQGGHSRTITDSWLASYRRLWEERQKQQKSAERIRQRVRSIAQESASQRVPKRIRGHKFVFTGAIEDWPRERRLYPRVRRLGGVIGLSPSAISSADCLVHGNSLGGRTATRKLKAATKRHVPIISEDEFFAIMKAEETRS